MISGTGFLGPKCRCRPRGDNRSSWSGLGAWWLPVSYGQKSCVPRARAVRLGADRAATPMLCGRGDELNRVVGL